MPRRPKGGKGGKRGKKGGKSHNRNKNDQSSIDDIDASAMALQSASDANDINRLENMEISDVASLVKNKLAELEETKKRKEYQSFFASPHALTTELRTIQSAFYGDLGIDPPPQPLQTENKDSTDEKTTESAISDATDNDATADATTADANATVTATTAEDAMEESTEEQNNAIQSLSPQMQKAIQHFTKLSAMIERADNLIYTLVDNEKSVRQNTDRVITQNQTMQQLCRRLQSEKTLLTSKIEEIQKREKDWHDSVQQKFQQSLDDIRVKISEHESRYNAVVKENGELHRKIEEYLSYDKRRTVDFEQYKEHCSKLEEIHEAEKSNLRSIVTQSKAQITQLTTNLQEALKINTILKAKNNEYEDKFTSMSKTLQDSTQCMDQFKSMKSSVLKQNKELRKQIKDLMSKYTQLNTYNDLLQKAHEQSKMKSDALQGKVDTLSQLCRKLQHRNRELQSGNVPPTMNDPSTVIPSQPIQDTVNVDPSPVVMTDDSLIADATDNNPLSERMDNNPIDPSQNPNEPMIAVDTNMDATTNDTNVDDDEADMPDLELLKPPSDAQPSQKTDNGDETALGFDIVASVAEVTKAAHIEDNNGMVDAADVIPIVPPTDDTTLPITDNNESHSDEAQTF